MYKISKQILKFLIKQKVKYSPIQPLKALTHVPESFLVISHTALGDTLMATPAIKSLKLSFPESKIIAVINEQYVPLLENFKYVDAIYAYSKGFFKILNLSKKLQKEKTEISVILHGTYPEDIAISIFSGIRFILKHRIRDEYKNFLSINFTLEKGHMIEKKLFLIKLLGGRKVVKEMEIGELENRLLIEKWKSVFAPFCEKKIIGFQLGASKLNRIWPPEYFAQLATILNKKMDCFFVLLGVKREKKLAERFKKYYSFDNYFDLVGEVNIKELPYVIKNLDLLITPDTGPLHLAIALKVKTVSLFAVSDPRATGPYQDFHLHRLIFKPEGLKCVNSNKNAMQLIKPEEVLKEVLHLLD